MNIDNLLITMTVASAVTLGSFAAMVAFMSIFLQGLYEDEERTPSKWLYFSTILFLIAFAVFIITCMQLVTMLIISIS